MVIDAGQSCRTPSGENLDLSLTQGVRTWGNSPHGGTVLLIGSYQSAAEAGQLVTSALPSLAVFTDEEIDPVLLGLLERELTHPGLGQESALDRILDLLLLHLVRASVHRSENGVPSWAAGTRDPIVARALGLLHEEPAAPWTVAELARRAHVSRATMAARFHAAVGQPPMTYLTAWRLALAADRLASSTATTAVIAEAGGIQQRLRFQRCLHPRLRHQPDQLPAVPAPRKSARGQDAGHPESNRGSCTWKRREPHPPRGTLGTDRGTCPALP
ncbi:AraC-like DNA-binding protein [Arthrobacter ginsengisoli]|uniref:AraC-like DNA-binding protein n=1 Tax=Arthrobacter ginsengisoli TaxID=1356565 RepID=A0ABU1UHR2_9MICC|nr:AraC family transcriptional regulator [Arthrobacter ginsengisoli]MDR7084734.1 AraC-like DNA-binding protein [Arthrobacter ginsengisoli]